MPDGTPTYIQVDAQGRVTAVFDGVIVGQQGSTVPAGSITGQLTDAQLAALAAAKITGQLSDAQLAAISATKLQGQINTTQITPGAIVTGLLAANSVVADNIAANAIDGSKLRLPPSTTNAPPPTSTIDWIASDGALVASIQANDFPSGQSAFHYAQGRDGSQSVIQMEAGNGLAASAGSNTSVVVGNTPGTNTYPSNSRTLLDSNNRSGFMKVPLGPPPVGGGVTPPADATLVYGYLTVTIPAGQYVSNAVRANHGLPGITGVYSFVTALTPAGLYCNGWTYGADVNGAYYGATVAYPASGAPAADTNVYIYWAMICTI